MRLLSFRSAAKCLAIAASFGFVVSGSAAAQTTHIVNASGFSFSPVNITIAVGDTVHWVVVSNDHTVTEGLGLFPSGGEAFNAPLTTSSGDFELTFDTQFLFDNPRPDNVYDYYCIPHFAFNMVGAVTVVSPWENEGFALAGVSGEPLLIGTGSLQGGTTATIELSNAAPGATVGLFVSFASTPVPFKGGMLCTIPLASTTIFPIGGSGGVTLPAVIPAGIPSGAEIFWQYAIQDGAAVAGVALSNCLLSVFP
ncbi:MAG: plastocyanin [Pseudohongiellaceae bacterium]|jgi:plastocyanin